MENNDHGKMTGFARIPNGFICTDCHVRRSRAAIWISGFGGVCVPCVRKGINKEAGLMRRDSSEKLDIKSLLERTIGRFMRKARA